MFIFAALYLVFATDVLSGFDRQWMSDFILRQGLTGQLLFVIIGGLLASIGMPRQVLAISAGFGYGIFHGVLLSALAAIIGCILTFSFSRFLAREWVHVRFKKQVEKVDEVLAYKPFWMAMCIRIMPLGSNFLTNIAAGVTEVSAVAFVAGSFIGFLPIMTVFAAIGSGTLAEGYWQIGVLALLFILATLIGRYLYKGYIGQQSSKASD